MLDALSLVAFYRPEEVGEKSESLTLISVLDEAAVPMVQVPLSFAGLEQGADEWHAVLAS